MSDAHETSDADIADLFADRLCCGGFAVPMTILDRDEYVKFPKWLGDASSKWLRFGIFGTVGQFNIPMKPDNILVKIKNVIMAARGKRSRMFALKTVVNARGQKEGAMTLEIVIEGRRLRVGNIAWPIHVRNNRDDVIWLLGRLRRDVLADDSTVEDSSQTTSTDGSQSTNDSPDLCLRARRTSGNCDEEVHIDKDGLPPGVMWYESKRSFVVTRSRGEAIEVPRKFRVMKRKPDRLFEIRRQRARAMSWFEYGVDIWVVYRAGSLFTGLPD